ncbi:MAG: cytochrome c [Pseudomonadota bacterium]|nr:cytochrome c [Pseudomonadota bacterium]
MLLLLGLTPVVGAAAAVQGDAAAGSRKVDMCIGCHGIPGYQASFPEIYKVPKIAGQNAKYLATALAEYKKGERKHPTMRAIAATLSEQDIADVAAYYEQLGHGETAAVVPAQPPAPSAEVAKLLAGQTCTTCHGANFNTPIDPSYPKLAGQHADYLYVALKAYQTQHNAYLGRGNAIMMGMAAKLTHPEIKQIAAYIASLPSELKTVPQSRFR